MKAKIKNNKPLSKQYLILFAIIFAAIGSYVIVNSFAASSPTVANLWVDSDGGSCTRSSTAVAYNSATACAQLQTAYNAASAGDTVLVMAGSYNTAFSGGTKNPSVTFASAAGSSQVGNSPVQRQSVTIGTISSNANQGHFVLDGVSLKSVDFESSASNITIKNSDIAGSQTQILIKTSTSNANILLDNDAWRNNDTISGGYDGRLEILATGNPSGVVVQNSLFSGGNADGVQNGAKGVKILNNEFTGLTPSGGTHTDCIQLYGSSNTLIDGNWMHNTECQPIGAFDGSIAETITNNVIDSGDGGYPYAITLTGSTGGTLVEHNTLKPGNCIFGISCGVIFMRDYSGLPISNGTSIRNNITTGVSLDFTQGGSLAQNDYNVCITSGCAGSHSLNGNPVFVGGNTPKTYAESSLTASSLGKGKASDGKDIGINIATSTPPSSTLPGDTNNDGLVNIVDLSTLLSHYNTNYTNADFNKDNIVNITDLSVLLSNFGKSSGGTVACTETQHTPGGSDGAGGCWPGPNNTGVPTGTTLTAYSGSCTITAANTIIDSKTVNCGTLVIGPSATNTVIKNSKINGNIYNDDTSTFKGTVTIQDSEVNVGTTGSGAVSYQGINIIRSNIHGGQHNVQCSKNCTITDSYLHDSIAFVDSSTGYGSHNNAFISNGGDSFIVKHTTLSCSTTPINDQHGGTAGCSADLSLFGDFSAISNVTLDNNLFVASTNLSYCLYGGDNSSKPYGSQANHIIVKNNIFQKGSNNQCGYYSNSAATDFPSSDPNSSWANNKYADGTTVNP